MARPPDLPAKVVVIGNSGSGKSTLAGNVARALEAWHIELDLVAGHEGWTKSKLPVASVPDRQRHLHELLRQTPSWVVEGDYVWWLREAFDAADLIVWITDPSWTSAATRAVKRNAVAYARQVQRAGAVNGLRVACRPPVIASIRAIKWAWSSRSTGVLRDWDSGPPNGDYEEWSEDSVLAVAHHYRSKMLRLRAHGELSQMRESVLAALPAATVPSGESRRGAPPVR